MLDTVNFKLTATEVGGVDFLSEIPPRLNPEALAFHDYGGNRVVTGKLENLSVSVSDYQVKIKDGSLCKYMLGDNYRAMGRQDIQRAIERLSDTLHLPIDRAIITRLDVGLTIPVRYPISNYLNHLGLIKNAKRVQTEMESLYYTRHRQAERLCFYDKNREQRQKGGTVPDLYRGQQVLRYEQRYLKQLPRLLKVPEVTGATLYDEAFYISLLKRWRDSYREIDKLNNLTLNFNAMKTKKEFQTMATLALVEQMGGELQMIAHINEAQKRRELTNKQAYDLRQLVKKACKNSDGLTELSDEIAELSKKINNAIRYYR